MPAKTLCRLLKLRAETKLLCLPHALQAPSLVTSYHVFWLKCNAALKSRAGISAGTRCTGLRNDSLWVYLQHDAEGECAVMAVKVFFFFGFWENRQITLGIFIVLTFLTVGVIFQQGCCCRTKHRVCKSSCDKTSGHNK